MPGVEGIAKDAPIGLCHCLFQWRTGGYNVPTKSFCYNNRPREGAISDKTRQSQVYPLSIVPEGGMMHPWPIKRPCLGGLHSI